MTENGDITIRRHTRDEISLRGEFVISPEHAEQVILSRGSPYGAKGSIPVRIVDISVGGLGWRSDVFLPRRCRGEIRVIVGEHDADEVVFTHVVEVRRVRMSDETPMYNIGAAFADPDEQTTAHVNELIACYIDHPGADVAPAEGAA
ncbi:MAG: PilZ domain-containing protein [Planctomycetota bacterium]